MSGMPHRQQRVVVYPTRVECPAKLQILHALLPLGVINVKRIGQS